MSLYQFYQFYDIEDSESIFKLWRQLRKTKKNHPNTKFLNEDRDEFPNIQSKIVPDHLQFIFQYKVKCDIL